MCFLALAYKTLADYAVVVAANRDEFLDRPGTAPQRIRQGIVGGVDLQAGGTWLAVSARGLVAAVTNIGLERPRAEARSRGLLCLDASELAHADAAPELLRAAVAADPYGPFNLLVADARSAQLATWVDGRLAVRRLQPGLCVVGNGPAGGCDEPKLARALALIRPAPDVDQTLRMLTDVCRDHGTGGDGRDALCCHGADRGTLCSSLLALHDTDRWQHRYLHAQGPPCRAPYRDASHLLRA